MADKIDIFENLPETTEIENILEEFDFDIVRSYMVIHNWKISLTLNRGLEIPTIEELKNVAKRLLKDALKVKENPAFVSTAGFIALKWGEELSLYFNIESWSTSINNSNNN